MLSLSCATSKFYESPKVTAVESSLQEFVIRFREVVAEFETLFVEAQNEKIELTTLKQKCNSKSCTGSEELKKIITAKENIIQLVAGAASRLHETRNLDIVEEIFKIICRDSTTQKKYKLTIPLNHVSPSKQSPMKTKKEHIKNSPRKCNKENNRTPIKIKKESPNKSPVKIKKEMSSSLEDVSFKDESMCEIDGTPGRTSPIIQSRKFKGTTSDCATPEQREKKKCPTDWYNPNGKVQKMTLSSPSGGKPGALRQTRIAFTTVKQPNIVDLTSSPEFCGGAREENIDLQKLIKKESSDNDDTIQPSPTSGPSTYLLSRSVKEKDKFKRPLSLKPKSENIVKTEDKDTTPPDVTKMEESINILKCNRFGRMKLVEVKQEPVAHTETEADNSMSLLQQVNKLDLENIRKNNKSDTSPAKRPLAENINVSNVDPIEAHTEASMSLLQGVIPPTSPVYDAHNDIDKDKRKIATVEPIYKEVLPRTKAEKLALPAWCCRECEVFYGALYKDDPDAHEKIAKVISACSRHRGRTNPVRADTPQGFWYPRWDVPEDTEEFNRRNDAV